MGLRKKESSDLSLRRLVKCLWESLILSLVLAAIEVTKLLNLEIQYIWKFNLLAVSLKTGILGMG